MTNIMLKTYDVLDEFLKDESFIKLKKLINMIEDKYKSEIDNFNLAKLKYQEVLDSGGKYHPDYQNVLKTLSEKKEDLYLKKEVEDYLKLERSFQNKLNSFINKLTNEISSNISSPNELGLVLRGNVSCQLTE